jgi:tryptophanase
MARDMAENAYFIKLREVGYQNKNSKKKWQEKLSIWQMCS